MDDWYDESDGMAESENRALERRFKDEGYREAKGESRETSIQRGFEEVLPQAGRIGMLLSQVETFARVLGDSQYSSEMAEIARKSERVLPNAEQREALLLRLEAIRSDLVSRLASHVETK